MDEIHCAICNWRSNLRPTANQIARASQVTPKQQVCKIGISHHMRNMSVLFNVCV